MSVFASSTLSAVATVVNSVGLILVACLAAISSARAHSYDELLDDLEHRFAEVLRAELRGLKKDLQREFDRLHDYFRERK